MVATPRPRPEPFLIISDRNAVNTGLGKKRNVVEGFGHNIIPSHEEEIHLDPQENLNQTYCPQCLCTPSPLRVRALFSPSAVKLSPHIREQSNQPSLCFTSNSFHSQGEQLHTLLHGKIKTLGKGSECPLQSHPSQPCQP